MPNSTKTYVFQVEMTCEGCANAITNVLNKHKDKGIQNFDVSLKEKRVTVKSTLSPEILIEIFGKAGKQARLMDGKN